MRNMALAEGEYKFAKLVWEQEPIGSGELVQLCKQQLGWQKSTTYTVLKKLCDKGILRNENAVVSAQISEEDYRRLCSEQFLGDHFGGSLPKFLTAFMGGKALNKRQADALRALIDSYQED